MGPTLQPAPPLFAEDAWLAVTPDGELDWLANREQMATLDTRVARHCASLAEVPLGTWLFELGAGFVSVSLPAPLGYLRNFSRAFVTALCGLSVSDAVSGHLELPPSEELLRQTAAQVPPMPGAEYVTEGLLREWWRQLSAGFEATRAAEGAAVQELLSKRDPRWSVLGRVHFHLAENKKDPERPFAFLATYATGVSVQGKPQHRPLGEAVRASSSARDKQKLVALLAPVQRAAARSAYVRALADSGKLFAPQAWSAAEAHRFLRELPLLEDSGVAIRVPDWWHGRRPPRPRVSASVGGKAPGGLGADALLDFRVELTLDGTPLSASELRALRTTSEGLVLLRGQWVEVDREKLDAVLAQFRRLEERAEDGLSFLEGMRLLAGVPLEGDDGPQVDPDRSWSEVRAGPWLSEALEALRAEHGQLEPPSSLRAELRPYQRRGLEWLWTLTRLRLGGCLADDMGLGKTVQLLALLLRAKEHNAFAGPSLLIVPASLLGNWQAEAARFAPSLRIGVVHPSSGGSALTADECEQVDLAITTYGQLARVPWLSERGWGLLVLDEAQAIKNPAAKQTRAIKALRAQVRFALTGTPVENRVSDLWSLFDFVSPGLLGGAKQFSAFVKEEGAYAKVRALTAPYLLRRSKTDKRIVPDLPDKTELKATCALTPRQAALYQQVVEELAKRLAEVDATARRGVVLATLMRLKQICNHPSQWLGDGGYAPEESGKAARLRELCEVIAQKQEKVLVFTQFREMTEPLARWLEAQFGRPGLVLSGSTAVKQRTAQVREFQENPRVPFFVLSLKAGGTGLNLTAAAHVIHFDRWWNPAVENQATDRAFRLGQKRNVLVHKLVCRGTVEERVDALIEEKQGLARELLADGGELRLTELSDRALLELVSLDLSRARIDDEERG